MNIEIIMYWCCKLYTI